MPVLTTSQFVTRADVLSRGKTGYCMIKNIIRFYFYFLRHLFNPQHAVLGIHIRIFSIIEQKYFLTIIWICLKNLIG